MAKLCLRRVAVEKYHTNKVSVFFLSAIALAITVPAVAQDFDVQARHCTSTSTDHDLRIRACTWLLSSGQLARKDFTVVYKNRSSAFGRKGLYDKAIADLKTVRQLQPPKVTWDVLPLAILYRDAGRLKEALTEVNYAFKFDEDGPGTGPGMAAHYHLGKTLHAVGRYAEAVDAYTKGIPKQPDYFWARYQRALSYEALGNRSAAVADLAFALGELRVSLRKEGKSDIDVTPEQLATFRRFGLL